MIDRLSSQLTFLLLWLSGGFFWPPSVRILQLLSCPFPFLPLVDLFPPSLFHAISPPQSAGSLLGPQRRMTDRMTEWWHRRRRGSSQRSRVLSTQRPPRSEGRLIPYNDSQEWGWKPPSDRMACLLSETISAVHSVAFEANLMGIRPVCLWWIHFTLQRYYCTDNSLQLDQRLCSAFVGWQRMRHTSGPVWARHYVFYSIYYMYLLITVTDFIAPASLFLFS